MGCSSTWITCGSSEVLENTEIYPYGIINDCTWVQLSIIMPWGTSWDTVQIEKGKEKKFENTNNPLEFIIVKCLDTWCPDPTRHAAKIEVCHELPPECPIPICDFIIS